MKEYLNQDYISYLMAEHEKGRIDAAYRLYRPMTLEIFLRQFLAQLSRVAISDPLLGASSLNSFAGRACDDCRCRPGNAGLQDAETRRFTLALPRKW